MTVVRRIGVANSVLKADGLAAGKGVVLPEDEQIAELTIHGMLSGEKFDGAGSDGIVIQERYHGPELSVMVISDGQKIKILPAAQDHKRLLDGDKGPNTGGMGAYAPVPPTIVTASQWVKIEEIAQRTIDAMAYEGKPFVGCLFMGLMLAEERDGDPVVIEFNARLGDPETEAILPILERGGLDVADMLRSSAEGQLRDYSWNRELGGAALSVCLAAEGYPDNPKKGDIIYGLGGDYPNVIVHQAGTQLVDGKAVTSGGRVGYVTGLGKDIDAAAASAYAVIDAKKVTFAGAQYRDDIGHQARQTT
jgi:phosphoribosylamine--glycine ligase